jgi:hypothetical protein
MARLEIDGIYGVNHEQVMWRTRGVDIAERDKRRPLRKLDEPLSLRGIHIGEFAVFVGVHVLGKRIGIESYLVTEVGPRGFAIAVQSDAVLERPKELCSPYLRYVLGEANSETLEAFDLTKLGEYVLQSGNQTPHHE